VLSEEPASFSVSGVTSDDSDLFLLASRSAIFFLLRVDTDGHASYAQQQKSVFFKSSKRE
jgi:hypothetical protein